MTLRQQPITTDPERRQITLTYTAWRAVVVFFTLAGAFLATWLQQGWWHL